MTGANMELLVFAVFDKKSETYNLPFFMRTMGEALRAFADLCQDEKTVLWRHPEDFKLVKLGTFNPKDGQVKTDAMETIAHADEFKRPGAIPMKLAEAVTP